MMDYDLPATYLAMKDDPENIEKQLVYFKALADGRLTDYYRVSDERLELQIQNARLSKIERAVKKFLRREDRALLNVQLEDAIEQLRKSVEESNQ